MQVRALIVVGLLGLATPASASVWDRAITPDAADAELVYTTELRTGDDHVVQADTDSSSLTEKKNQLRIAFEAYRRAAAAKPASAEPYFRIAETIYSFYIDECGDPRGLSRPSPLRDCSLGPEAINTSAAQDFITAIDQAEALAPLDPRFSSGTSSVLFDRALVNTRLATQPNFARAAADYEAVLARSDLRPDASSASWSNLAETFMMMGQLDDAIDGYREALHRGASGEASTWMGYAVALDRDGRGSRALQVAKAIGEEPYENFRANVLAGSTFYVPFGEKYYYFALGAEAFGAYDEAKQYWAAFLRSGAQPQFEARAKQHLDALNAKPTAPTTNLGRGDAVWRR